VYSPNQSLNHKAKELGPKALGWIITWRKKNEKQEAKSEKRKAKSEKRKAKSEKRKQKVKSEK
jgi:hypothetical protein